MLQFFSNTLVFDFQKSGYMFTHVFWSPFSCHDVCSVIEISTYISVHVFCLCFLNMLHIQTPVTHTHIMDYAFMSKSLDRTTELAILLY
ncbi:hypothetical protein CY34DRAFT_405972 [Suillus luteus UH-Slu-Lm8-n1]|uniref:Uncharacterized protein n=1 Tax=Suillus luteus UH-Slu-Lm8-n1 TaxID=930992 RepID=A0A0D0AUX2_9AGAM|nr:hypothetical protein CY34DRAFT_405972 [Suillus luteus UH-Slu-Lm8-n1]